MDLTYEQTLASLLGLVGRKIQIVMFVHAGAISIFYGTLSGASQGSVPDILKRSGIKEVKEDIKQKPEVMVFAVENEHDDNPSCFGIFESAFEMGYEAEDVILIRTRSGSIHITALD